MIPHRKPQERASATTRWLALLLELHMSRSIGSILPLAILALVASVLAGCSTDVVPSGPQPPAKALASGGSLVMPSPRLGPEDFVEIVAGEHHTCARKLNQKVYCWGKNNLAQTGVMTA